MLSDIIFGSLKSAMVGGFTCQKSANAMNQDIFPLDSQLLSIYQHLTISKFPGKESSWQKEHPLWSFWTESVLFVENYNEDQYI